MATRTVNRVAQAGALLLACATIVAVGCAGRTERRNPEPSAGGASAGQGGESAGGNGTSGGGDVPIDANDCNDERCDLLVSNSCVDGTCVCGDEPACSGCRECLGTEDCPGGLECSPNHECIGCTSDEQCASSAAGTQCVDITGGKGCRPCDPSDNAGCPPGQECKVDFVCGPP